MNLRPTRPNRAPRPGGWQCLLLAASLSAAVFAAPGPDQPAPLADLPLPERPGSDPSGPISSLTLADPPLPSASRAASPAPAASEPLVSPTGARPPSQADHALTSPVLFPSKQSLAPEVEKTRAQLLETQLNLARQQRRELEFELARKTLMSVLESGGPEELRKAALLELALVAQDANQPSQALRILAQYIAMYQQDASVPEVLLRQGLLYRQIGATGLAIAKFYAVMTATVPHLSEHLDHYERLVLQAQAEIAETFLATGKLEEAAELYNRLLRRDSAHLHKQLIHYKLIRCLAAGDQHDETATQAQRFVDTFPDAPELPEVRFILATAYKQAGRPADAQRQVLDLLEAQRAQASRNPAAWAYWQRRAGNEIANQFYSQGDFETALSIYLHLAALDPSPAWRIPVWHQIGLVYERLLQPAKAAEFYDKILNQQKELTGNALTPSLASTIEMARWRKEALHWLDRTQAHILAYQGPEQTTKP